MLLQDKVAVITGGAGPNGLGFATARLMAAHGAKVAVLDLARAQPAQAAAQLGADHLRLVADVTDLAQCQAAVTATLARFGRIDILVNNAGITQGKLDDARKADIIAGIPLSRLGSAKDVAGACLFLASDLSAYCTGITLDVNGGMLIH